MGNLTEGSDKLLSEQVLHTRPSEQKAAAQQTVFSLCVLGDKDHGQAAHVAWACWGLRAGQSGPLTSDVSPRAAVSAIAVS